RKMTTRPEAKFQEAHQVPAAAVAAAIHVELRRWAHLLMIAPMSANLLATVTGDICDNLLTNVIRAWDINSSNPKRATIIAAPAMNSTSFLDTFCHCPYWPKGDLEIVNVVRYIYNSRDTVPMSIGNLADFRHRAPPCQFPI